MSLSRRALGVAAAALALAVPSHLAAGQRTSIRGEILSGPRKGEVVFERVDRERQRHRVVARTELVDRALAVEFIQPAPAIYRLRLARGHRLEMVLHPGQRLEFEWDPRTGAFRSDGSPQTAELHRGLALDRDGEGRLVRLLSTLDSPLAVYGLVTRPGRRRRLRDHDLAELEAVHDRLAAADPEAAGVGLLGDLLERYRLTAVGAVLPDATLKDPDGRIVKLSHLRGRWVLVDLWASGCAPCRRQGADLIRSYRRYGDRGFTIYSISFDTRRDVWMKAIRKDGLDWPYHVWDLEGRGSEAFYAYATEPPARFLLDPRGRVVAKDLRGEALARELEKIFGF